MVEHFIFLLYLALFIVSCFGYGLIFSNLIDKEFLKLNPGYIGVIGIFFSIFISAISSFFFPHNFIHNFFFHTIGLISFIYWLSKNLKKELLLYILLFLVMIIGTYVYKNHDDFPYYHLTYALNLSENSFIVGTGAFSHGFKTPSSIFYYHSLLYMPGIKYYLFHIGPFFILYFFNIAILYEVFIDYIKKKFNFIFFFRLISFVFINIVFYRIGEHGTDRSSQLLLVLIFILFFEILYLDEKKKNLRIKLFFLLVALAASIKVLYYIYFVLLFFLIFERKINYKFFLENYLFIFLVIIFSSTFILKSFLSTGCLVYPAEKTCFEKFDWSVSRDSVAKLNIHYEWWAKSGGSANYKHEMTKAQYIENFNWLQNWFERHFIGKVTDTLGVIFLITLIFYLSFKGSESKYIKRKNFKRYAFLPILFLIEWFLNHPSMRYGGFILFALPPFIYLAGYLEKKKIQENKIIYRTSILIFITFLIFNLRNIERLKKEITFYNYNIISSPFFYVPDVKSKVILSQKNFLVFKPIDNMCWASKTPCSYNSNIKIKDLLWMKVIYKNDK